MKRILYLIIMLLFSSTSSAASLKNQLNEFNHQKSIIASLKKQLPKDIEDNIYKEYAKNVQLKIGEPQIVSVTNNIAKIQVVVDLSLPYESAKKINETMNKYLEADPFSNGDGHFTYTFSRQCFRIEYCKGDEFHSPVAPIAWKKLSDQALTLDLILFGDDELTLLIGEEVGGYGTVYMNTKITYTFDIPESRITDNPKIKYKFKIYNNDCCFVDKPFHYVRDIKL